MPCAPTGTDLEPARGELVGQARDARPRASAHDPDTTCKSESAGGSCRRSTYDGYDVGTTVSGVASRPRPVATQLVQSTVAHAENAGMAERRVRRDDERWTGKQCGSTPDRTRRRLFVGAPESSAVCRGVRRKHVPVDVARICNRDFVPGFGQNRGGARGPDSSGHLSQQLKRWRARPSASSTLRKPRAWTRVGPVVNVSAT